MYLYVYTLYEFCQWSHVSLHEGRISSIIYSGPCLAPLNYDSINYGMDFHLVTYETGETDRNGN